MSAPGYARALAKGPFKPGPKGLRFVLPPEGRVEGVVVAKDTGKPLPNVRVTAMSGVPSGMHHAYAKTDPAGRFAMSGLTGGKYKIETVGEVVENDLTPPEWIGSIEKVAVETGRRTSNVRIEAVRGGLLELVLTDATSGQPVKDNGVVVISNQADLRINHWATPSRDGVIRLRMTPGSYVVTGAITTAYTLKEPKSGPFGVEAGKTSRVTFAVQTHKKKGDDSTANPAACVKGVVYDPQGKPVSKAKISVLPLFGDVTDLVAGDDGRFSILADDIGLLAGFAWIRHPQKELVALGIATLASTDAEGDKLLEHGITVLGSAPRKVTLRSPVLLSGVVCNPQGEPIPKANVTAQVDGSHLGRSAVFLTTTTDQTGRYSLGLAAHAITSYAITVEAPGYNGAEVVVDPTELVSGRTKAAKIVLYRADRTVHGIVRDKEGRPVPGTVVTAEGIDSLQHPGCAVSDAEGRIVLERLDEAGTIYLHAHVPGRGWTATTTICPGQKEVVITVAPCHWE